MKELTRKNIAGYQIQLAKLYLKLSTTMAADKQKYYSMLFKN